MWSLLLIKYGLCAKTIRKFLRFTATSPYRIVVDNQYSFSHDCLPCYVLALNIAQNKQTMQKKQQGGFEASCVKFEHTIKCG